MIFNQQKQRVDKQLNVDNMIFLSRPMLSIYSFILYTFIALFGLGISYVGKSSFDDSRNLGVVTKENTENELREITSYIDPVIQSYVACRELYSAGKFLFSYEIERCQSGLVHQVNILQDTRDKYLPLADMKVLQFVDTIMRQIRDDQRQLLSNILLTKSFEDNLVRSFISRMCFKSNTGDKTSFQNLLSKDFQTSLNEVSEVMFSQSIEYYVIRDFILPRLNALKELIIYVDRDVHGLYAFTEIKRVKSLIEDLLRQQIGYNPESDHYPFQHGLVRRMQSRNIVFDIQGPAANEVEHNLEEVRSSQVKEIAPFEALRGRDDDIRSLISCGVLKPDSLQNLRQ